MFVDRTRCISREQFHVTVGARLFGFDNEGITAMISGTVWSARLENNLKEIRLKHLILIQIFDQSRI